MYKVEFKNSFFKDWTDSSINYSPDFATLKLPEVRKLVKTTKAHSIKTAPQYNPWEYRITNLKTKAIHKVR